jgi:hypothetical protein
MKLIWVALIACLLSAQTVRVGTFDKPSVVVAYYRSPIWAETLRSQRAELQAARQANDSRKVQKLEEWGGKSQELAHRQLAGKAPITNILEALGPAFPEIARKAQVTRVAADIPADGSVQAVDVTDLILDWLKADEATRKIVHDLRKH